jgi:hypothetical protein
LDERTHHLPEDAHSEQPRWVLLAWLPHAATVADAPVVLTRRACGLDIVHPATDWYRVHGWIDPHPPVVIVLASARGSRGFAFVVDRRVIHTREWPKAPAGGGTRRGAAVHRDGRRTACRIGRWTVRAASHLWSGLERRRAACHRGGGSWRVGYVAAATLSEVLDQNPTPACRNLRICHEETEHHGSPRLDRDHDENRIMLAWGREPFVRLLTAYRRLQSLTSRLRSRPAREWRPQWSPPTSRTSSGARSSQTRFPISATGSRAIRSRVRSPHRPGRALPPRPAISSGGSSTLRSAAREEAESRYVQFKGLRGAGVYGRPPVSERVASRSDCGRCGTRSSHGEEHGVEAILRIVGVSIVARTRPSLRDRVRIGCGPDDRNAVRGDRLHA